MKMQQQSLVAGFESKLHDLLAEKNARIELLDQMVCEFERELQAQNAREWCKQDRSWRGSLSHPTNSEAVTTKDIAMAKQQLEVASGMLAKKDERIQALDDTVKQKEQEIHELNLKLCAKQTNSEAVTTKDIALADADARDQVLGEGKDTMQHMMRCLDTSLQQRQGHKLDEAAVRDRTQMAELHAAEVGSATALESAAHDKVLLEHRMQLQALQTLVDSQNKEMASLQSLLEHAEQRASEKMTSCLACAHLQAMNQQLRQSNSTQRGQLQDLELALSHGSQARRSLSQVRGSFSALSDYEMFWSVSISCWDKSRCGNSLYAPNDCRRSDKHVNESKTPTDASVSGVEKERLALWCCPSSEMQFQ